MTAVTCANSLQVLSLYPAPAPPVGVRLFDSGNGPCPYLPGRRQRTRAFFTSEMNGNVYHQFMDAGFRRSGEVFYQNICPGCRECVPIRVPTETFSPGKSQRRVWRRNADVSVNVDLPRLTDEKYQLYSKYQRQRHGREDTTRDDLNSFLYVSPVDSLEFEYRDPTGKLLAVSITDLCEKSLSSVYTYFDPDETRRSVGVYSALFEIAWAREHEVPYYYLGFWLKNAATMGYKADYHPYEILRTDGLWMR